MQDKKQIYEQSADGCVCCGEYVPEGRQVCPTCEKKGDRAHELGRFCQGIKRKGRQAAG